MRKVLYFTLSTLLLASCESENILQPEIQPEIETTTIRDAIFRISGFRWEKNTRTLAVASEDNVELYWAAGDTIGVFPTTSGSQIEFVVEESKPVTTASCDGGAWAFREGNTYAAFYPYNYHNHTCKEISLDYTGQTATGNNNLSSICSRNYIYATATAPVDNIIDFELQHIGALLELSITLPEGVEITAADVALSIVGEGKKIPTKLKLDLSGETLALTTVEEEAQLQLSVSEITPAANNIILYAMLPDLGEDAVTLAVSLTDADSVEYIGNNLSFNQGVRSGNSYRERTIMEKKVENQTQDPANQPE